MIDHGLVYQCKGFTTYKHGGLVRHMLAVAWFQAAAASQNDRPPFPQNSTAHRSSNSYKTMHDLNTNELNDTNTHSAATCEFTSAKPGAASYSVLYFAMYALLQLDVDNCQLGAPICPLYITIMPLADEPCPVMNSELSGSGPGYVRTAIGNRAGDSLVYAHACLPVIQSNANTPLIEPMMSRPYVVVTGEASCPHNEASYCHIGAPVLAFTAHTYLNVADTYKVPN